MNTPVRINERSFSARLKSAIKRNTAYSRFGKEDHKVAKLQLDQKERVDTSKSQPIKDKGRENLYHKKSYPWNKNQEHFSEPIPRKFLSSQRDGKLTQKRRRLVYG
jgi:hypothetical protein